MMQRKIQPTNDHKSFLDLPFPDADIDFFTEMPSIKDQYLKQVADAKADAEREAGFELEVQSVDHLERNGGYIVRVTWCRKRPYVIEYPEQ
jgi:hypothetical protein